MILNKLDYENDKKNINYFNTIRSIIGSFRFLRSTIGKYYQRIIGPFFEHKSQENRQSFEHNLSRPTVWHYKNIIMIIIKLYMLHGTV